MSASIGEPFLLASYASTRHDLKRTIFASGNKYITVTAHHDGIHVLDLTTLHPIISHTLGPSTSFTCPAITKTASNTCTTYAAVDASPDLPPHDAMRTICFWTEDISSTLSERTKQKRTQSLMPHAISAIHIFDELDSKILVLSPFGETTVTGEDLKVLQTHPGPSRTVLRSFVFARSQCDFVPSKNASTTGVVAIFLENDGDSTRVRILGVADSGIVELSDEAIQILPESIISASCSGEGYLSIMTQDGSWSTFYLQSGDVATISILKLPLISLANFSFLTSKLAKDRKLSLLALTSSHVLLAAVSTKTPTEILLQTWDLQYSIIVASTTLSIPATLPQNGRFSFEFSTGPENQALLVLSPLSTSASGASPQRTSVFVVPYTIPSVSTIAGAMGKASSVKPWLAADSSTEVKFDSSQAKVLKTIADAIESKRPQVAATAFNQWEKLAGEDKYTTKFVQAVLDTVLQPGNTTLNAGYSSDVVKNLLTKHVVRGPGLLGALRARGDWTLIELALETVVDIPEDDILATLAHILAHGSGNMQVDSSAEVTTTLPSFLYHCVDYTTSPAPLRLAIRRHLIAAEDVTRVLVILEDWIARWGAHDVVFISSKTEKKAEKDLPPLPKVLIFLQTVLDASFIAVLQHMPAHAVMRKIFGHLQPELLFSDQLQQLQAPLEPFAKAQQKLVREARDGKEMKEPMVDWRRRKKEAHDRAGMSVGLYKLEELLL